MCCSQTRTRFAFKLSRHIPRPSPLCPTPTVSCCCVSVFRCLHMFLFMLSQYSFCSSSSHVSGINGHRSHRSKTCHPPLRPEAPAPSIATTFLASTLKYYPVLSCNDPITSAAMSISSKEAMAAAIWRPALHGNKAWTENSAA